MVVLRIIFEEESDSRKLPLESGFPATVSELHAIIKTFFQLPDDFRLQDMDPMFNEFMNLDSVSELEDRGTLKIIYTPLFDSGNITLYPVDPPTGTSTPTYQPPTESSTTYVMVQSVDPDADTSTTTYQPGTSTAMPPAGTSTAAYMPPAGTSTAAYMPPAGTSTAAYMPPAGTSTAAYMPPAGTSAAAYMPPAGTSTAAYMPPAGTSTAAYMPPAGTSTAAYMPSAGTSTATYMPSSGTSTATYMPPAGTSTPSYMASGGSSPSSLASSCCDDTWCTSTPHSSPEVSVSGLSTWPKVFVIPKFTYDAEYELQQKNAEFESNGTYFTPGLNLKRVILEGLAQEIMKYTKYPKDYQWEEVAGALIRAHPCLAQMGATDGFGGWKTSLKFKMQNYRTKLGRLGHPEIRINSLKHKREGKGKPAAKIKKPRKAEVNYIPLPPKGETTASLEKERIALVSEIKKKGQ
ncbi:uncharacterized protein LOC127532604 [Acanthochromis polyacanthus]|uniref:uncharacterized protein LOC127532604 n=1 Tax=Acanthochromis polyacanthus TaxID=80966 RepID=UPI0022348D70|nr:uncharacterized protein LOC127532604 [Acanthochromis polyacanthus]